MRLLFITLLLNVPLLLFSQLNFSDFQKKEITVDQGLPQNTILSIRRDDNGYYWILTNSGLVRWNGTSLNSTHIKAVDTANTFGNLKVTALFNQQIAYRNSVSGWFLVNNDSKIERLPVNQGDFISLIGNNCINILRLTEKDLAAIRLLNSEEVSSAFISTLKANSISNFIIQVSPKEFYVYTKEVLFFCSNNKINHIKLFKAQGSAIPLGDYLCIFNTDETIDVYKSGQLYLSQKSKGLLLAAYLSKLPWCVQRSNQSTLLGIKDNIVRVSIGKNKKVEVLPVFSLDSTHGYTNFYYDEDDRHLLLGTSSKGCEFYRYKKIRTINRSEKANTNIIYTLIQSPSKQIITNQDIFRINYGKNGTQWQWGSIGDIKRLHNGQYVCGGIGEILLLDTNFRKIKSWKTSATTTVQIIQMDSLLIYNTGALGKINLQSGVITNESNFWPEQAKNIKCLYYDISVTGKLYGVVSQRLCVLDIIKKEITYISNEVLIPQARSVMRDKKTGLFLITTEGNGIFICDGKGRVRPLPDAGNTALLKAHYIAQDKEEDFWIPTNAGIFFLSRKKFNDFAEQSVNPEYVKFDRTDGIENDEFNGGFNNAFLYTDNTFYMANMKGIVNFSADIKRQTVEKEKRIIVNAIWIDDSLVNISDKIILSPYFKELRLDLDAAFFTKPGVQLQYRVKGSNDSSWNYVNLGQPIAIKYLRPGAYTLQVRIHSDFQYAAMNIDFYIRPYWYNTWWAYLILFLLIAAGIYLFVRWKSIQLKHAAEREIQKNRERLFSIVAHDLRSPVNTYVALTDTLAYLIKNNDFERMQLVGAEIDKTGKKLSLFMNNLFNWSLYEQNFLQVREQLFDIGELLNEILPGYESMMSQKRLTLQKNILPKHDIKCDKNLLSLILRNLFDNAVKYAVDESVIGLKISFAFDKVMILIENSIQDEQVDKINTISRIFHSGKKLEPGLDGLGFGMVILRNAVTKMDGEISFSLSDLTFSSLVQLPVK